MGAGPDRTFPFPGCRDGRIVERPGLQRSGTTDNCQQDRRCELPAGHAACSSRSSREVGTRPDCRCSRSAVRCRITPRTVEVPMEVFGSDDLPIVFEVPDAEIRSTDVGGMTVSFYRLPAGDLRPILEGLPGDACPCPHWGYVVSGRLRLHTGTETPGRGCRTGLLRRARSYCRGHRTDGSVRGVTDSAVSRGVGTLQGQTPAGVRRLG